MGGRGGCGGPRGTGAGVPPVGVAKNHVVLLWRWRLALALAFRDAVGLELAWFCVGEERQARPSPVRGARVLHVGSDAFLGHIRSVMLLHVGRIVYLHHRAHRLSGL